MNQLYKFRSIYIFYGILTAVIFYSQTWKTEAAGIHCPDFRSPLTIQQRDTVPTRPQTDTNTERTITVKDTTRDSLRVQVRDTSKIPVIDTFSVRISSDSLDAPVNYEAADSAVVLVQDKMIILYGKTKTVYKDITLTAPQVEINQQTQVVTAVNRKDSTGETIEVAHFKSGENEFSSDTIQFNFKTQLAITKNTYSQQGELLVIGEVIKKVNATTTFIRGARFTTCLLDDPHFDIKSNRMKVVSQKLAVSGPAHLEFEGVPIPIYIPFGFYPLNQGRHSGLLPPQFTTREDFGLGLEGLGYYKVINDYWDVKVYGNIHSYGAWAANLNPTYRRRYRYSGSFNLSVQETKLNFRGDPDYIRNRSYFVVWNHAVDSRARPGTNFSASVNAGSTQFNTYVPNDPRINFQNQLGSSIAYSKTWAGKPYNLTLSANHNQNNLTRLINVSLPDAGFTVTTIYPFEKKEQVGTKKWYENIGIGYNGNFRNQFSFYDTAFQFKRLIDTLQWGAQHNFPLITSLPPLFNGAVIVSPTISYQQVWIAQKFRRKWNIPQRKLDTTITKGFFMDHQIMFGISFNTAIFGTYQFKKSRIVAIRHVIRPSFSLNYKPDLSRKHFYSDTVNRNGDVFRFSEFEGALYSGFSEGRTGGIGFQLDNNLEMKWRSKKDTGESSIKKIKLIDGYGFTTGYNFLRDSMKLDIFNLYLRTTLFDKISITASGQMTPYKLDAQGRSTAKYAWDGGKFKLGTLTFGTIAVSSNFKSKPKDPKKEEMRKKELENRLSDPTLIGDQRRLMEYMQQNPTEFVDFNVQWQLNLGYSLSFQTVPTDDFTSFRKDYTSNLTFSGSFNLSEKWNVSANGYFDVDTRKLETFQMGINRDMHCWQMTIQVTPVGPFRSFSFAISPKASVLQDLKINRTRSYSSNF